MSNFQSNTKMNQNNIPSRFKEFYGKPGVSRMGC